MQASDIRGEHRPVARPLGNLYRIGTSVTIDETNDSPVGDARVGVAVKFPDGDVNGALPRADTDGKATFSFLASQTGTYTFTVKGVRKTGRTYDPALNVETSDSITIP